MRTDKSYGPKDYRYLHATSGINRASIRAQGLLPANKRNRSVGGVFVVDTQYTQTTLAAVNKSILDADISYLCRLHEGDDNIGGIIATFLMEEYGRDGLANFHMEMALGREAARVLTATSTKFDLDEICIDVYGLILPSISINHPHYFGFGDAEVQAEKSFRGVITVNQIGAVTRYKLTQAGKIALWEYLMSPPDMFFQKEKTKLAELTRFGSDIDNSSEWDSVGADVVDETTFFEVLVEINDEKEIEHAYS